MEFIRISDCLPAELSAALEWNAMCSDLRAHRKEVAGALGEGQEHRPTATRGRETAGRTETGKGTATKAAAKFGSVNSSGSASQDRSSGTHTGTAPPKGRYERAANARSYLVLVVDNG